MSDVEQVEMTTPANGEMPEAQTLDPQKEIDQLRVALKKANSEAASKRKLLETFEAERKAREDAELSEMDKLRKELAETRGKAEWLELSQRKAAIAAKVGLPSALADRLQGDTDEAMEADANTILALIPQPNGKKPPQLQPTNPGNPQEVTETREQKLRRLGFA